MSEIPVFTSDDRLVVSANASQSIRSENAEVCRLGLAGLAAHGFTVSRVAHDMPPNPHNAAYLATKRDRQGHML